MRFFGDDFQSGFEGAEVGEVPIKEFEEAGEVRVAVAVSGFAECAEVGLDFGPFFFPGVELGGEVAEFGGALAGGEFGGEEFFGFAEEVVEFGDGQADGFAGRCGLFDGLCSTGQEGTKTVEGAVDLVEVGGAGGVFAAFPSGEGGFEGLADAFDVGAVDGAGGAFEAVGFAVDGFNQRGLGLAGGGLFNFEES